MNLRGETVLVTGASSEIGAATAVAFGREGARVVLLARREAELEKVGASVRAAGGTALAVAVDLSDPHAVSAAMERVLAEAGVPAVVVNNAGAGRWLSPEETPPEEVVSMMAAPYFAAFWVTRAVLPGMLARGSGRIVNVTSPVSFIAWPGATAYAAARWAMRGFHEALSADLAETGVGVTLATFGKVSSDYFTTNAGSEERVPKISKLVPTLTPDEAAAALVAGVRDEDRTIIAPFMLRLFLGLNRVVPGVVSWITRRTGYRRKNG